MNQVKSNLKIMGPAYFLELQKIHGDTFFFNIKHPNDTSVLPKRYLFSFSPEFAEEVYIKQYKNFIKSGGWHIIRKALGNGLLTSEEPVHLKHRRILNPAFHINKINYYLNESLLIIKEETSKWIEKEFIDINEEMFSLSYKVLTNTIFNDEMLKESEDLKDIFFQILSKTSHGEDSSPGTFEEITNKLNSLMYKVIQNRVNNEREDKDFIDLLIMASHENESMSVKDISDEVITMLMAGHETTANTLAWCLFHMAEDTDYWDSIASEYDNINCIDSNMVMAIRDCSMSKFAIDEALRLYPPVWFSPRMAVVDTKIGDFEIKTGTNVILSSFVTHRSDKYFEDPYKFIPMRWANGLEESLPEGSYFPFHMGPRKCIGYQFAMAQSQMTLIEMAKKMKIELISDFPKGLPIATYRPEGKVIMRVSPRDPQITNENGII